MVIESPSVADLDKFNKLRGLQDVAEFLETTPRRLSFLLFDPRKPDYKSFQIKKARGGFREISSPPHEIYFFQRKILSCLTSKYIKKQSVHSFVAKRNVETNASAHLNSKIILNIDLIDFFPSIHFGRVRGVFQSYPLSFNPRVSSVLAQICCFKGKLPQGAPTSPIISNFICRGLDEMLLAYAKKNGCRYTRYADDITFSFNHPKFPEGVVIGTGEGKSCVLNPELIGLIEKNDFKINPEKTRIQDCGGRQVVTGLTVNKKVNVRRKYVRNIRAILHDLQKRGKNAANSRFIGLDQKDRLSRNSPSVVTHVYGKLDFLKMVKKSDDEVYVRYAIKAQKICPRKKNGVELFGRAALNPNLLAAALWIVVGKKENGTVVSTGTAFSFEKNNFVSALHIFVNGEKNGAIYWELINGDDPRNINRIKGYLWNERFDLVKLIVGSTPIANLKSGLSGSTNPLYGVAGFPDYNSPGDRLFFSRATLVQSRRISMVDFLLTDAHITEGISGGPILDSCGFVAGVVLGTGAHSICPNGGIEIKHFFEIDSSHRRNFDR